MLAELHGGSADAASDGIGKGSRFTVRLPRVASADEPRPGEADMSSGPRGRRILVIEDNRDAREMLSELLRYQGHDVHEAGDGAAGVALATRIEPEVVIVDIGLPVIDGYEVARQIRQRERQPRHLIALTGYGQPEDRRRCVEAGFDAHIVKPIDIEQLLKLIAPA
jgi:CheY-like chemotaxis protein